MSRSFKQKINYADIINMNLKNLTGAANINTLPATPKVSSVDKSLQLETTQDRDPQSQGYQQQNKKKEKMSREQAEKSVVLLNAKSFMSDMKWTAYLVEEDGYFFAEVKDQDENLIRRLSEYDLWEVFESPTQASTAKGNLLKRTA